MKKPLRKIALALASLAATLLALEAGARLWKGVPLSYRRNFVETRIDLFRSVYPMRYDPYLGWIPKPGDYSRDNYWGKSLTILDQGVRSNGRARGGTNTFTILAVGDSFTYGSQVADDETWPAELERLSGARVINGGVFAYGLDQTVLRTERLADVLRPDLIVVSFIPDNVNRAERSVRTGTAKPYFEIANGALELRNVPVPDTRAKARRLGVFRRVAGYSYLMDGLMRRLGREEWWYLGDWERRRVHRQGFQVSCLLMERLARFARERGLRVAVLAQYTEEAREWQAPESREVAARAASVGLPVLDLYEPLHSLAQRDPPRFQSFFRGHMTPAGNAFVARRLLEYLQAHRLIPCDESVPHSE